MADRNLTHETRVERLQDTIPAPRPTPKAAPKSYPKSITTTGTGHRTLADNTGIEKALGKLRPDGLLHPGANVQETARRAAHYALLKCAGGEL